MTDIAPAINGVISKSERSHVSWKRKYTVLNYIMFFFSFALMGWLWEVSLHIVRDHALINRGVLLGPWLPIYGTGGVLILLLLKRFFDKPIALFFLNMVICSIVEYFTSWYLEYTKGIRWWDYSGYLFNINGRICLEGAIIFGLGGCLIAYVLAPRLCDLYSKIPVKVQIALCVVLIFAFSTDVIHSRTHPNTGAGITDYATSKNVIAKHSQQSPPT